MRERWKWMWNFLTTAFCAVIFAVVGIRWLLDARAKGSGFTAVCALLWLAGSAIWAVRTVRLWRERKAGEKEGA